MRLTEITKDEFVEKLKDPRPAAVKEFVEQAKELLEREYGWKLRVIAPQPQRVVVRMWRSNEERAQAYTQIDIDNAMHESRLIAKVSRSGEFDLIGRKVHNEGSVSYSFDWRGWGNKEA